MTKKKSILIFSFLTLLVLLIVFAIPEASDVTLNEATTSQNLTCSFDLSSSNAASVAWYMNATPLQTLNMPFEGNSSNALLDYSGLSNNGINNGASWNSTGGNFSTGAFDFVSSESDFINISSVVSDIYPYGTSIEALFYVDDFTPSSYDLGHILWIGDDDGNGFGSHREFHLTVDEVASANTIYFWWGDASNDIDMFYNTDINTGEWYHVVVTIDNASHIARMYINGSQVTTDTYAGEAYDTSTWQYAYIGRPALTTRFFDGQIDYVRIWNRTLTPEQITTLYNNRSDIIVSQETNTGEIWQCRVTPFNATAAGVTVQSNNITIGNIVVNITTPANKTIFNTINNIFSGYINGTVSSNAACTINDTRFETILNNGTVFSFYNSTLNDTTATYDLTINCTNTSTTLQSVHFIVDADPPFVNVITPQNNSFQTVNYIQILANIADTYLNSSNVSVYNSSGESIYANFTSYSTETDVNLTDNITGLAEGTYTLEICAAQSASESPKIQDKTTFASNFTTENQSLSKIAQKTNKTPVSQGRFNHTDIALIETGNTVILRTIQVENDVGNAQNIRSNGWASENKWDTAGEHLKSTWRFHQNIITPQSKVNVSYQCLSGCQNLNYLSDRGRDRIIDDKHTFYFDFSDAVEQGWDVSYQPSNERVSVIIEPPNAQFLASFGSTIEIDPIMGGLSQTCKNATFTYDITNPQIEYESQTQATGAYVSRDYFFVNLTQSDTNYNDTIFYLYNSTGGQLNATQRTDISLTSINFTSLSDGAYYFNATITDGAGNQNSTLARNITIDLTSPQIEYESQTQATGAYVSRDYFFVNLTQSDSNYNDTVFYLYNSTGGQINATQRTDISLTSINFTSLSDGAYYFNATITDGAGNQNSTLARNITIDTTLPSVSFTNDTIQDGNYTGISSAFVNLTQSDTNYNDTIFYLYRTVGGQLNATQRTNVSLTSINFTSLSFGTYYINATVTDLAGNQNSTITGSFVIVVPPGTGSGGSSQGSASGSSIEKKNLSLNLSLNKLFFDKNDVIIANITTMLDGTPQNINHVLINIITPNGTIYKDEARKIGLGIYQIETVLSNGIPGRYQYNIRAEYQEQEKEEYSSFEVIGDASIWTGLASADSDFDIQNTIIASIIILTLIAIFVVLVRKVR